MDRKTFKDSQEANFRRLVRQAIRKADFTKGERDVILALINHYFHHKAKKGGLIHPGRKRLAKVAGVSIKTVQRCLAQLRAAGVIIPISNTRGGFLKSTVYKVDIVALLILCGCDWIDEFRKLKSGQNVPRLGGQMSHKPESKMSHKMGDKMSHRNKGTSKGCKPIQARGEKDV